jgi:CDP-paratose 2-epimerase
MLSLLDLITLLEKKFGGAVEYGFDTWRPGDQRVFVSDVREATHDFGWTPRISVADGVDGLLEWLEANRALFPAAARGGDETMAKDLRRCGGRQGLAR